MKDQLPETAEETARLMAVYEAAVRRDIECQDVISMLLLGVAITQIDHDPSEELRLTLEAHAYEASADWPKAEDRFLRLIGMAEQAKSDAWIAGAHLNLCRHYRLLGQHENAADESCLAVASARCSTIGTMMFLALEAMAGCLLTINQKRAALETANQVVRYAPLTNIADTQRARALVCRARCLVEMNDFEHATADVELAMSLLSPHAELLLSTGIQVGLATGWDVTARIRRAYGDMPAAVEASCNAVWHCRYVAMAPEVERPHKKNVLATALQFHGENLEAAGDYSQATTMFEESASLRRTIGLLPLRGALAWSGTGA